MPDDVRTLEVQNLEHHATKPVTSEFLRALLLRETSRPVSPSWNDGKGYYAPSADIREPG
jgi:hypothetical protein